jgi:hypothetical protein
LPSTFKELSMIDNYSDHAVNEWDLSGDRNMLLLVPAPKTAIFRGDLRRGSKRIRRRWIEKTSSVSRSALEYRGPNPALTPPDGPPLCSIF